MKSKCPETRYKINPNVTLDRFYQLLNVYFNDMQKAGGSIYQLASEEFTFAATCSEKEQTRKISFNSNK